MCEVVIELYCSTNGETLKDHVGTSTTHLDNLVIANVRPVDQPDFKL